MASPKVWLGFVLSLLFSFSTHAAVSPVSTLVESATNPTNYLGISPLKDYYTLKDQLETKQVELKVLNQNQTQLTRKITELETQLANLNEEKNNLESVIELSQNTDTEEPSSTQKNLVETTQAELKKLKEDIVATQKNLAETKAEFKTLEATNLSEQTQLKTDLETLQKQITQAELKLRNYVQLFSQKIGFVLAILLLAQVLKWLFKKIIHRFSALLSPTRQQFLLQLVRLGLNFLAGLAIILVFFSQLIKVLPYFAIFASVVTLALKDVILSVIAWLIIGTKDGYKVGHYLHIGELWGTVVEINPFNTIVRQGGISGPTGRLLTFPNKKIFEEFLENWSKWYDFTYLKWDFFLEPDSNLAKAEDLMYQVLKKARRQNRDLLELYRKRLLKLGIGPQDLEPNVFWEIQANGVLLRGKLLVHFDDFFLLRSQVTKEFIEAIAQEDDIHLRFVNNLIPNTL